jgi:hypothetical protein
MLYRFADFNAGHFASRNAAFQNAVAKLSRTTLALDGDLVLHRENANDASKTELATRSLTKLALSDAVIRRDLERGAEEDFATTRTYQRVFELAGQSGLRALPRAVVPQIRLQSAKIMRKLTTEWFATRVNDRYGQCLARAGKLPRK